ncbi:hypothetical protein BGZ76_010933 [Entomortierella beljakovae]|nr:hypothetical protein BGZ76_010933 [Entomortierella beljakovae]
MSPIPAEITYDVQNIHTAITYAVPDIDALVGIVGRREYHQLVAIARQYKTTYGVDLPTELDRRIIGSVGSLLSYACMHKVLAEVQFIHKAGKSNRKYEALRKKDSAIEVFCEARCTPEELRELDEAYTAVYHSDMKEHVLSFCKSDITTNFFTNILKDKEDKPLENVEAAIEAFHQLLNGHDIAALIQHVSSLTTAQLHTLVRSYNAHYRDAHVVTTLEKTQHKGEHLDILLFAVMQASDPGRHVSLLMEESMSGVGTNEDQLSRLVVLNRGKIMESAKTAYGVDYSRTLADRIRGDTSGVYSHLLCHLINQTI